MRQTSRSTFSLWRGRFPKCQVNDLKKKIEELKAALKRASGGDEKTEPILVLTKRHDDIALLCLAMFGAVNHDEYTTDYELFYPEGLPYNGGQYGNNPSLDESRAVFNIYGRPALDRARQVYTFITQAMMEVRAKSLERGYSKGISSVMETLTEMSEKDEIELETESFRKLGFDNSISAEHKLRKLIKEAGDD